MDNPIIIPNGAILNCYLPKKKGSLKRAIMNAEAKLIQKRLGFEKLLNHTAMIERIGSHHLVWEASVIRGVSPTELSLYSDDAVFIITTSDLSGETALLRLKSQSGKSYDVGSWWDYAKFLVSGRWKGDTEFKDYSKKWFCSEVVDYANDLSQNPFQSTPNHVYRYTKQNEVWSGTYADLVYGLKMGTIQIK